MLGRSKQPSGRCEAITNDTPNKMTVFCGVVIGFGESQQWQGRAVRSGHQPFKHELKHLAPELPVASRAGAHPCVQIRGECTSLLL